MAPYFRKLAVVAAAGGAVVALAGAGAATASTAVKLPASPKATVQCKTVSYTCVSPDFYATAGPEATLQATSFQGTTPIITATADDTNPMQDWRFVRLGTVNDVTHSGDELRYGLTGTDVAEYGNYELFSLQFAPGGFVINKCAANIGNRLTLRTCNPRRWQIFIQTPLCNGVPLVNSDDGDGSYYLSVVQAENFAGHNAGTAGVLGSQVTFSFPTGANRQNIDMTDPGNPGS